MREKYASGTELVAITTMAFIVSRMWTSTTQSYLGLSHQRSGCFGAWSTCSYVPKKRSLFQVSSDWCRTSQSSLFKRRPQVEPSLATLADWQAWNASFCMISCSREVCQAKCVISPSYKPCTPAARARLLVSIAPAVQSAIESISVGRWNSLIYFAATVSEKKMVWLFQLSASIQPHFRQDRSCCFVLDKAFLQNQKI